MRERHEFPQSSLDADPEVEMMDIFFHAFFIGPGMLMLVAAVLIAALVEPFLGIGTALVLGSLVLISTDLLYRHRKIGNWKSVEFFDPLEGGSFMFIPMWIIGLAVILFVAFS